MMNKLVSKLGQIKIMTQLMDHYPKIKNPLYLKYYISKIHQIKRLNDFNKILGFLNLYSNVLDFIFLGMGGIYTKQVKSEILSLLDVLKKYKPKVMLEIGTAGGGSLFLFSKVIAKDATIISLDLPRGIHGGGYPDWKSKLYRSSMQKEQNLHLIRGNSHDPKSLDKVKKILKGKELDFLFIDGDHTYEGAKTDFELYKDLVKKNGLIALHDIVVHPERMNCHVNELWNEIKGKYKYKELVEDWNQQWAGIGLIFN